MLCGDAARLLKDYTDYRTACEQEAERQAAEQAAREEAERKAGKQDQGMPQAPWIRGGARNKKGQARHPGARFWDQPKKEKKFIHPANAKKAKHNRTNYQGRHEPDFGRK